MTNRQSAVPLVVSDLDRSTPAELLQRIDFSPRCEETRYDEKWIQQLIMDHPAVLPIGDLEPALTAAVPLCIELPTSSGFVDNLFVTADSHSRGRIFFTFSQTSTQLK